jgi:hypothetical protein
VTEMCTTWIHSPLTTSLAGTLLFGEVLDRFITLGDGETGDGGIQGLITRA